MMMIKNTQLGDRQLANLPVDQIPLLIAARLCVVDSGFVVVSYLQPI
jgi:hypothetical protein